MELMPSSFKPHDLISMSEVLDNTSHASYGFFIYIVI